MDIKTMVGAGAFPGGPVAETSHLQSEGPEFDPWLGN